MRIPKDAFFAHQVMWDGWVKPEHPRVHINGHWNYPAGSVRTVYVEANTPTVELKLNGHSLGVQHATHDFLFTWPNVHYAPGRLEAIAYDKQHRSVATTVLETAGQPVALRLTPHIGPGGLRADGSDLVLVDVEVVDAKGERVPTALNMVDFSLSGPAEWRGGIAQGTAKPEPLNTAPTDTHGMSKTPIAPYLYFDNYVMSQQLPVEGGINRVSIRSTTKAGTITLVARSKGLREAELTFTSRPSPEHDGLSTYDPSADLPVNLERGPTPDTPSYSITRIPVSIASATAGANAAEASNSYDDNETTAWTNASSTRKDVATDGLPIRHAAPDHTAVSASLETAWIEYTLAKPASPFEMDMKLGSFRLRRYPLRITLDGQVVYEGTTPTSLGYVTLPLKHVHPGTKLRIQLTAPAYNVEEKHQLVELNGKVDQAQPVSKNGVPVLSILEAEIYEKPKSK